MIGTIYSIIPALIMLILVLLTRKVLLSLGAGIVVGALFIHEYDLLQSINEIWTNFYTIFYSGGGFETGNIQLLSFLLLLGIMTAFLQASGGSKAFGDWVIHRIKTRRGAQLVTPALGLLIFIDDYFNALAVGQIARPLTDRHKISRAKLAYYIDSTSAPITVISPISSWGAYLIGIIGSLVVSSGIPPLEAFIKIVPYNFYALGALLLVFLTAYLQLDIGTMRKHEERAIQTGEVIDPENDKVPGDLSNVFKPNKNGTIYHLILPIAVLVVATVITMTISGAKESPGERTVLSIFENTNVNFSLFIGGLAAAMTSLIFHFFQRKPKANTGIILREGIKTMLPAIYILLLAWMIGSVIDTLQTGEYLAELVSEANIDSMLLPFLFFLISGVMAVATGTSWGTFGIMLPIAAEVTISTDVSLLLPTLASVLAGSVFGDHCTPISDTTILSSTGAGANHIDHVITQLPYAIIAAVASAIGYLLIGLTGQMILGLLSTFLIIVVTAMLFNRNKKTSKGM
ncbi:Na+/H+ antiporter NhaC family protein [Ornithinibacillus halophilus]|uniref:Na+/H+ antiporter NhaC n=1 Tax=Ornithinibacillus halophilus TaxID=930117 RepID=A0A1M5JN81_9BACI|nr:Na+/H+ antiporter NhaC family protein [Ornithinibacillus halophilus]SHG42046.1 Na+/H+ antiporter NhaC [Ornithinibacillus halophilus]